MVGIDRQGANQLRIIHARRPQHIGSGAESGQKLFNHWDFLAELNLLARRFASSMANNFSAGVSFLNRIFLGFMLVPIGHLAPTATPAACRRARSGRFLAVATGNSGT